MADLKHQYREKAVDCNPEEFEKVVRSRRSVRIYNQEKVPADIVRKCMELALLAPNSSNLQPWKFYWVRDAEKKGLIAKACLNQLAARTAAELIVCVAEPYAWKQHCKEMAEMFQATPGTSKAVLKYYTKLAPFFYTQGPFSLLGYLKKLIFFGVGLFAPIPREPSSRAHMNIWAVKTTALACENLMLAFRAYGYDSCPMEGFDSARVKKALGLKCKDIPIMVVSAGKRAEDGVFGPQFRFDSSRFIRVIGEA